MSVFVRALNDRHRLRTISSGIWARSSNMGQLDGALVDQAVSTADSASTALPRQSSTHSLPEQYITCIDQEPLIILLNAC
jgi:hypothetical protein